MGVLMIMYAGRERIIREGMTAASELRHTATPRLPSQLLTNERAWSALPHDARQLWDFHTTLSIADVQTAAANLQSNGTVLAPGDTAAYAFKLFGLLRSRFNRTLFLDCDVIVLRPSLAHDLLVKALDVADVAMPLDPGRTAQLTVSAPGAQAPPWIAVGGPPLLCSAVLAFQRNRAVEALFVGAARRLLRASHHGVRQGDQEMIWFEWVLGSGRQTGVRVLALPEETYCPLEGRQRPAREWRASTWRTSWRRGVYPCASVHGHAFAALARSISGKSRGGQHGFISGKRRTWQATNGGSS